MFKITSLKNIEISVGSSLFLLFQRSEAFHLHKITKLLRFPFPLQFNRFVDKCLGTVYISVTCS